MRGAAIALASLIPGGCAASRPVLRAAPEAELASAEQVAELHLSPALIGLWFARAPVFEDGEGTCPARLELGASTIWLGDCVDEHGREQTGSLALRRGPGRLTARYERYSASPFSGLVSGRVRLRERDGDEEAGETEFEVDLRIEGEDGDGDMAIRYEGRTTARLLDPDWEFDAPAVWSGAGSFASEELGRVEVETLDERLDRSRCGYEPLAGTTILRAGGRTAVIRYDGAQDCDREGTATWTLDGEAMGELSGINCTVVDDARGRTGTAGWPWLLALMLGLGSLRVRARAR